MLLMLMLILILILLVLIILVGFLCLLHFGILVLKWPEWLFALLKSNVGNTFGTWDLSLITIG